MAAETKRSAKSARSNSTWAPPYRPLWVYRFFAFIRRLPIPGWLLVTLIIVLVGVANHLVAWQQGYLPYWTINGYLTTVGLYIVLMPAVWAFLVERAHRTLLEFFEGRGKSRAEVQAIVSDFNSLPDWAMGGLLALGALQGYLVFTNMTIFMIPISGQVLPSLSLLSWLSTNGFIYAVTVRAVRQLGLIKRLFSKMEVDIFNRRPIYALSRYASLVSIVALVVTYGLQSIVFPSMLLTPFGIVLQILILILALALFLIPLVDINRAMRNAKESLLAEMGKDLKDVQARVHQSVAQKNLANISDLKTAVGVLKEEMDIVQKISPWPWQAETLRNLFVPLLIPILVFLMQRFLSGMLGLQ